MSLSPDVAAMFQPYAPGAASFPKTSKRGGHRKRLITRLLDAQGGFCAICGQRLRNGPTVDHVIPRSHGGGNDGNRLIAHVGCNFRKRDRMPTGCELLMLEAVNARLAA